MATSFALVFILIGCAAATPAIEFKRDAAFDSSSQPNLNVDFKSAFNKLGELYDNFREFLNDLFVLITGQIPYIRDVLLPLNKNLLKYLDKAKTAILDYVQLATPEASQKLEYSFVKTLSKLLDSNILKNIWLNDKPKQERIFS